MGKKFFRLESRIDGLGLSVMMLVPEENVKLRGIIQFLHGMSEYKERYLPIMQYFAERGFVTIIHDHRGHGKSVRTMNDYGYMYGSGTEGIIDDVCLVNEYVKNMYPELPLILLGHSMGSLVARTFIREYDERVDALVLSGAPCKNGAVDAAIALAKIQEKIYGSRHKGTLLNALAFGGYIAKFKDEKSKFAWVCSDKKVVEEYDRSPLCGFTFTIDGFCVLFNLLKQTYTKDGWNCTKPEMPIYFVGGAEDPCIGGAKNFREEMDFMKTVGYEDVEGVLYPGMRHEVFNEKGQERVFRDIEAFISKYLPQRF